MTQDELKSILRYEPETGLFYWRVSYSRAVKIGSVAGTRWKSPKNRVTYLRIQIKGKVYRAHRLAFLYKTGKIPKIIDHDDGDGLNNAWNNLKDATNEQNLHNAKISSTNTSGVKGVYWNKREGKWYARVAHSGKRYHCGCFDTLDDAKLAVQTKRATLHGEFCNHG